MHLCAGMALIARNTPICALLATYVQLVLQLHLLIFEAGLFDIPLGDCKQIWISRGIKLGVNTHRILHRIFFALLLLRFKQHGALLSLEIIVNQESKETTVNDLTPSTSKRFESII